MSAVTSHHIALLFGALAAILVLAKLLGSLFERLDQPAVLGEILAGVLLGNLPLVHIQIAGEILRDPAIGMLAEIGVVLLLFQVGLESDVGQMLRSGWSSLAVATVGVVTPMALGFGVARWLLPQQSWHTHVFIGAILTATSVGITARVFKDLNRVQSAEGRIVLGAAVIDDVMGLVVLAVVRGLVHESTLGAGDIIWLIAKALLFLAGAIVLGPPLCRRMFRVAAWLQIRSLLLPLALSICFTFAYLSDLMGLAPIVGAFAAGLILDEISYQPLLSDESHGLQEQVRPIGSFLIPIFFVVTGTQVDLRAFADPQTLILATALTIAAILGKQVCGLAAIGRGLDRLSIGIGMIPRGEVGLIFAAVGSTLILPSGARVVDGHTGAAVVIMVFATSLVTPPVLAWSLGRKRS